MGKDGILAGVRVVEIGAEATASLATRPLAEHGATVIRVEVAQRPGVLRTSHGTPGALADPDASPHFAQLGPDKWSVAIDAGVPSGAALVLRLAARADVVALHGDLAALAAAGLAPAMLRAQRPELVVLTSGDRTQVADPLVAGRMALLIAAALLSRTRSGAGRHLDMSDDSPFLEGEIPACEAAGGGFYPCAGGGQIAIEITRDEEWRALAELVDAAWADDPRFVTARGRTAHRDEIDAAIAAFTRQHAPYPLMGRLQEAGVPAGVQQDLAQVLRDPQLAHRHHFTVLDHAVLGRVPYERSGFRLSAGSGGFEDSAPLLGEDDDLVFGQILALTRDEIERLVADGAIEPQAALSTRESS